MYQVFARPLEKALLAVLGIAAMTGAAAAQAHDAAPIAKPGFAGRWELDLARMPSTYGPPPKRVVYAFDDVGSGRWRTVIDIVAPDGSVRHSAVTYRPDGSTASGEGDVSEADSAAVLAPTPTVLIMNLAKNKAPRSVRVYTLAAGGSEMTESAAAVTDDGYPYIRTFHFKRLR